MRREIVYDDRVLLQLSGLGDLKRLDERMSALEWAVWLDAEDFPMVDGTSLRVARVHGVACEPTLRIFFEIESDHVVVIHWVEPI